MITIAGEQMACLAEAADERFVRTSVEQMQRYDPLLARAAGDAGLAAAARMGLATARRHGFADGAQVKLCLELGMSLGSGFATDPQYRWLRPFLEGIDGVGVRERSRLLWWHATLFLDRVHGATGANAIAAAERASLVDLALLEAVGQNFESLGPRMLVRLHPQRSKYLDGAAVTALLAKARADAARFGLAAPAGTPLLLGLMFLFGHRVSDDPLHPWVGDVLADKARTGSTKVAELLQRAQTFASVALAQVRKARR